MTALPPYPAPPLPSSPFGAAVGPWLSSGVGFGTLGTGGFACPPARAASHPRSLGPACLLGRRVSVDPIPTDDR